MLIRTYIIIRCWPIALYFFRSCLLLRVHRLILRFFLLFRLVNWFLSNFTILSFINLIYSIWFKQKFIVSIGRSFRLECTFLTLFFIFDIYRILVLSFNLVYIMVHYPIIEIRCRTLHNLLGFFRDDRFKFWNFLIHLFFLQCLISFLFICVCILVIQLRPCNIISTMIFPKMWWLAVIIARQSSWLRQIFIKFTRFIVNSRTKFRSCFIFYSCYRIIFFLIVLL